MRIKSHLNDKLKWQKWQNDKNDKLQLKVWTPRIKSTTQDRYWPNRLRSQTVGSDVTQLNGLEIFWLALPLANGTSGQRSGRCGLAVWSCVCSSGLWSGQSLFSLVNGGQRLFGQAKRGQILFGLACHN